MQGRPKGGKNKFYTKEEKIKIVEMMLNGKTAWDIEREYEINHSVSSNWLKKIYGIRYRWFRKQKETR